MDFSLNGITSGIKNAVGGLSDRVGNILDPSNARLTMANLIRGGRRRQEKPYEERINFVGLNGTSVNIKDDWRIRVSVSPSSGLFYTGSTDPGILKPLRDTQGVIFPYTPNISVNYSATYGSQKLTHSNYTSYFFETSEVQEIQLNGPFTVQNVEEGQYLLASIYFFRSVTKMFYGAGANSGNPPPVVFLDGYGSHYFPHVPCIITGFTHTMPDEVDYIEIPIGANYVNNMDQNSYPSGTQAGGPQITRLPITSDINIRLQPIYSRKTAAEFDLEKFARGGLLDKGFI